MIDLPSDKIHIRDLTLRCIIGVYDAERHDKQDVTINLTLDVDLREAGRTDDLAHSVDYKAVKSRIVSMVESSSFLLIEALAERVAEICLASPRVQQARVLIEKPAALRFARTVGVEIVRQREQA